MDQFDPGAMGSLNQTFDQMTIRNQTLNRQKQEKPLLKYSMVSESGPIYLYQNPDLTRRMGIHPSPTINKYSSAGTTNGIMSSMNAATRPFTANQYSYVPSTDPYARPVSAKDLMTIGVETTKTSTHLNSTSAAQLQATNVGTNAFFRTTKPSPLYQKSNTEDDRTFYAESSKLSKTCSTKVVSIHNNSTTSTHTAKQKFEATLNSAPNGEKQGPSSRPPSAICRPVSSTNVRNPNYSPNKPYSGEKLSNDSDDDKDSLHSEGSLPGTKANLNSTVSEAISNLSRRSSIDRTKFGINRPASMRKGAATQSASSSSTTINARKPPTGKEKPANRSDSSGTPSDFQKSDSELDQRKNEPSIAVSRLDSGSIGSASSSRSIGSDEARGYTPYYLKSVKPEAKISPVQTERPVCDGSASSSVTRETRFSVSSKPSSGVSSTSGMSPGDTEADIDGDEDEMSDYMDERMPGDGEDCEDFEDDEDMIDGLEDDDVEGGDDDDESLNSRSPSSANKAVRVRSASATRRHHSLQPTQPLRMKSARWRSHSQSYPEKLSPQPPLIKSLFKHVPPYINFVLDNEKVEALPWEYRRLLKWRMTSITPNVVKNCIARSGFRATKKHYDWVGCWGKHMKSPGFKSIRDYQKLNHFPGSFQIGRKDRLWRNLFKMQIQFGKKEFSFFPVTYVLPQDTKGLKRAWDDGGNRQKWIIKPPASARGIGIKVINKWTQIPKKRSVIVQKYLARPLLINESKFDCRVYVYVTSYDPLRIYVFEDGLVRFCSMKYSHSMKHINNKYMHLTNYSIQKKNDEYEPNSDDTVCQGHKWSLKSLWGYLLKRGVNTNEIWKNIKDLIVKTIICAEGSINSNVKANCRSRYSVHELFGFDIILDEQYRPFVLEVNISPSLHSNSQLDINIKGSMIKDLHNLAGFRIPDKGDVVPNPPAESYKVGPPNNKYCTDKRLNPQSLSTDEKAKHAYYCQRCNDPHTMNTITDNMTPDDLRILIESIDEDSRKGGFQRVFPTPTTNKYLRYFDSPRYYNIFLDHWCQRFNRIEAKGIGLIEAACKLKIHLQNPTDDSRYQWSPPNPRISLSSSQLLGSSQVSSALSSKPVLKKTTSSDLRSNTAANSRHQLAVSTPRTIATAAS